MATPRIARSGDVELAYSVEGPPGPETVLLIMGLGSRAADWGAAFPAALAERYRVVRFDNRGVGASPRAQAGYGLGDLARDATAVLDAVGAARAHVVGISMGGMIAQLVALDHPARVDRLVLIATHFGGADLAPMHPDARRLFDPAAFQAVGRDPAKMMRATLEVITAPGFVARHPEAVDELVEHARQAPTHPAAFMAQLQALLASDRSGRVRDLAAPTLVIHGTEDKLITPENGRRLAARIPGARLELFDGCGHMPMYEQPARLAATVLDFLAG